MFARPDRVRSLRTSSGAVALVLSAWLSGCTPLADSEQKPDTGNQLAPGDDAGANTFVDDAGNTVVKSVRVHVAGLVGKGLVLEIDGQQQLPVPADGIWTVPLAKTSSNVTINTVQQPKEPDQRCDVSKLDEAVFTIACTESRWLIGGQVVGLEGKGLRLELFNESETLALDELAVAASGEFKFAKSVKDDSNYAVRIEAQPTSPRQVCQLENDTGFADGFDISDVKITCTTKTYTFTSVVTGYLGKGLKIKTGVGSFEIKNGTTNYVDNPYPDGFHYDIEVAEQPVNPPQVCYITGGEGVIDGANVTYNVVCDAAGTLRISEVGACPFSNSSCWFEIINIGSMPENLAFYKVRTSALSKTAFVPSRAFVLPQITVPSFGSVVIMGKTPGAMKDGQGVYHIADGDSVPWWGGDGFVELLNPSGATASFLRFGSNTVEPTTGGTWGGGAAPALPKGANAYGSSLQHAYSDTGLNDGKSYPLRAFATFGGPNDVSNDIDADNDGIPDTAERPGGTFAGLNLYGMGARTGKRDVFVEIDYMGGGNPATTPRREALDKLVDTYARRDIAIHFDVGNLYANTFDPSAYNLGGGNAVQFSNAIGLAPTDPAIANLYDYKASNMEAARRMVFYYMVFGWSQNKDGSGGSSGIGELPGNDTIITLGGFGLTADTAAQRNLVANYQAASMMHELGHNFGLRHGGGDQLNRKPNYVSVMNYLYSPLGLPTVGNAEGDRYDLYRKCTISSVTQLTNAPTGDPAKFLIDYSSGTSRNLDESALLEAQGLGRDGSKMVDFNCNGRADAAYSRDLNADGALDVLADNNDWQSLDFVFRRSATGAESGPSLLLSDSVFHDDTLTADTKHDTDLPCPKPEVPNMADLVSE